MNRIFDEKNLQIENEEGSIILLGYGGILDALNKPNEKYGTDLVKAFHDLKEKGFEVSADAATVEEAADEIMKCLKQTRKAEREVQA